MARAKKKPEKQAATWLTTYADFMTAMFAFFVILFALSDIDENLFAEFAQAAARRPQPSPVEWGAAGRGVSDTMGNGMINLPDVNLSFFDMGRGPGTGMVHHPPAGDPTDIEFARTLHNLQTYFGIETPPADLPPGQQQQDVLAGFPGVGAGMFDNIDIGEGVTLAVVGQTIIITFGDGMLFDSGRADIRPETFEVLAVIAQQIHDNPDLTVNVIGHTDNVPIRTAQFADNWDLSSARANAVLRYLIYTQDIDPGRVTATGRGEYSPVADNATAEGRALNRRVEIQLINDPTRQTNMQID
ncbi:MAG: flagellar motor protein MotB [Defluviitaleaceae bacterium]|nr:flagellar motor protein MotB [Defluviitaleaceae bacterium]